MAQKDSPKDSLAKQSTTKKALQLGLKYISTTPQDTIVNEQSDEPYKKYEGYIIRSIHYEHIGFEKSIYDSIRHKKNTSAQVANFLHVNTRPKIIRKHLFISPNQPLNPYRIADNERFLRDRDFILDSRIVATPVEGTDSVDLLVITRDVFSIGGSLGGSATSPKFSIYDANLDGRGQRLEFKGLLDPDRTPLFGYSLLYRKSSILGSLANFDIGYTQLNDSRSYEEALEYAVFTKIDRPLVSPYSRLAGGLEVSRNWSNNVYDDPDSVFLDYKYGILDTWLGYNFGIKRNFNDRKRLFLAVRYFNGQYNDQPEQREYLTERRYNDLLGYLAEFTFYKQDFYKTRYIFGFGRTEDIPYGISLGVTSGYVEEQGVKRPYSGIKLRAGQASGKGNFYRLILQAGGYYNNDSNDNFEDVIVQGGLSYFTRALPLNRYKLRSYLSSTFTTLQNRNTNPWVRVGGNEIPGFSADTLFAKTRFNSHFESVVYTPWSFLGFRFAPFVAIDYVWVDCVQCTVSDRNFWGYSSGIRTRNENLIFGTMEVKATFIPTTGNGNSKFNFSFKQNLRVKNTGVFVNPPSLLIYN